MSSSALTRPLSLTAMPMLAPITTCESGSATGTASSATMRAATSAASAFVAQVLEEHRKLVAAHAGHGVDAAHALLEPDGDGGQRLVAGGVAAAVVDGLEVVEVDEQQRKRSPAAFATHQGVAQAVAQEGEVAEAGEGVVEGRCESCSSSALRSVTSRLVNTRPRT